MDKEKNLAELTDEMFKEITVENPSSEFTEKLMKRIATIQHNETVKYTPLLSKKVQAIIYGLFSLLVLLALILVDFQANSFLHSLDLTKYLQMISFDLPSIKLSKPMVYSILGLGLMTIVQITFLKKKMDTLK